MKSLIAAVILMMATVMGVRGETTPEIDSMIYAAESVHDTLRPGLYNDICWKLKNIDPEMGLRYGRRAAELAESLGQLPQLATAYSFMGVCHKNTGSYDKALECYEKCLKLNEALDDQEMIAYANINLANLYLNLSDSEKGLSYLKKVAPIGERLQSKRIMAYYHLNLGRYNMMKGNYENARDEFKTTLILRQDIHSDVSSMRTVRRYIADLNVKIGDTVQAMKDYFAIMCDTADFDMPLFSDVYNSMANIYLNRAQYDSVIYYASKAMEYATEVGAKQKIGAIYGTLGMVYYKKKNYAKAAEIFQNQLTYSDQVFNDQLNQSLVSIRYSTDSEKKQMELDALAEEQRTQTMFNYILATILLLITFILVFFVSSNRKIKRLNEDLDIQRNALDETNRNLTSSITYARRIQQSAVNSVEGVKAVFPDSMVFYRPRDIVSGDWYRVESRRGLKIIVEADCTGHGVPGSLLSMMGMSALKDILNDMDISGEELEPATILSRMRIMVKNMLLQQSEDGMSINDGMDMTIGIIDPVTNIMRFGSAYQMAILVRNGESIKLKGDRMPIGNYVREKEFTSQEIQLQKGDAIFFMSDGIKDQTNPKMEKFKSPRLDDFLLSNIHLPMEQIGEKLQATIDAWRNGSQQVDDMTMVGVRI